MPSAVRHPYHPAAGLPRELPAHHIFPGFACTLSPPAFPLCAACTPHLLPSPALPRASPAPSRRRLCPVRCTSAPVAGLCPARRLHPPTVGFARCAVLLLLSPALPRPSPAPSRRRLCPVRCVSTPIAGPAPRVAVPSRGRLCPVRCASSPVAGLAPCIACTLPRPAFPRALRTYSHRRLCPARRCTLLLPVIRLVFP
ncbi:hypothetical protein EDB86DRAFT_2969696 [Lactarius hatsudake]|nr:hypothetical protein EDB86DRAFT_2969696 [Lactarius hatsudake]